ncbi:hypothetical protein [Cellulomonas wangsupingiae]|uniref:hypothetical protein n=1 Tax=Cellulomonas wangsupingiae TaxID=2968085 RepID=UPI001D0E18D6|nr:hypothetical protein [Cellulomonas wangsupingiae]MCM0639353.1 hypothetical protein [Cellulomonas wangsupingiae]
MNLGFVALVLRVSAPVLSTRQAIEALASKLGAVALLLGAFHLANVLVLSRVRRRRTAPARPHIPHGAAAPQAGQWTAPPYGGPTAPYA